MKYKLQIITILGLIFWGCERDEGSQFWQEHPNLPKETELKGFSSCQALERYLEDMMIKDMEIQPGYSHGSGWHCSSTNGNTICHRISPQSAPSVGDPDHPRVAGGPGKTKSKDDFTTTNVQEKGVDEADFVKNDRNHIYLLHQNKFITFLARPGNQTKELSKITIQGEPKEMFVANKKAIIFSTIKDIEKILKIKSSYYQGIKITLLDLSNLYSPKIIRELYLEGVEYINSRRIGDIVHIVTYQRPKSVPPGPDCYKEYEKVRCANFYDEEREEWRKCEDYDQWLANGGCSSLKAQYRKKIREKSLSELVPHYYEVIKQSHIQKRMLCPCSRFFAPELPLGRGIISVLSLNLNTPYQDLKAASLVMNKGIIYASSEALYIASPRVSEHWWYWTDEEESLDFTLLYKFDLSKDPQRALYVASGKIEGHILNQFSLGEYEGFLRVAVTVGDVSRMRRGDEVTSINHVFVLEEIKNSLRVVGEIRDMAPNERIYSARFMGKRGYVVTFKKVDPFFTLDLSDPYNPRIVGEWKGPGFSTYIHPMDEDHVLTIGKDTEEAAEGDFAWFQGVQLSIFDLSDLSEPKLLWKEVIGSRGTHSEALYEHRAFTYFGKRKVLAIPIELYEGGTGGSDYGELTFIGLHLYRVDLGTGFDLLGQVGHKDLIMKGEDCGWSWRGYNFRAKIRRSIIIGDYLYSISSLGLKVNLLDNLKKEVASISFSCN